METNLNGIVIGTSPRTKDWLREALIHLTGVPYKIMIVGNGCLPTEGDINIGNDWNGYELGAIAHGYKMFKEFVFLPDTCFVKDISLFDKVFDREGGVALCKNFFSYLGKYNSKVISEIGVPKVTTQREAVDKELHWNKLYMKSDLLWKYFEATLPIQSDKFIDKNGRKNMVLENDYLIKYKGTWEESMIRDE